VSPLYTSRASIKALICARAAGTRYMPAGQRKPSQRADQHQATTGMWRWLTRSRDVAEFEKDERDSASTPVNFPLSPSRFCSVPLYPFFPTQTQVRLL
jgi:hypothetical protein